MPDNERNAAALNAPRAAIIVVCIVIVLAAILGFVGGNFIPHKIGMPAPTPHDAITIP